MLCEGQGRLRVRTPKVLKLWTLTLNLSLELNKLALQKNMLLSSSIGSQLFNKIKDRISFPDNYLDLRSSLTGKQTFFALLSVSAQGWPRAVAWQVISGTCGKWRMFATRSELSEYFLICTPQTPHITRYKSVTQSPITLSTQPLLKRYIAEMSDKESTTSSSAIDCCSLTSNRLITLNIAL